MLFFPAPLFVEKLCVIWITQWHLHQTPLVFTKFSRPGHAPLSDLHLLKLKIPFVLWSFNLFVWCIQCCCLRCLASDRRSFHILPIAAPVPLLSICMCETMVLLHPAGTFIFHYGVCCTTPCGRKGYVYAPSLFISLLRHCTPAPQPPTH